MTKEKEEIEVLIKILDVHYEANALPSLNIECFLKKEDFEIFKEDLPYFPTNFKYDLILRKKEVNMND